MSPAMERIAETVFPNAIKVTDRFHVMKNIQDDENALRIRIKTVIKKQRLESEKEAKLKKGKYTSEKYMNGETKYELITRVHYQLCKRKADWK